MGDEKTDGLDEKDNGRFYEENLKLMLPDDNIHKDAIDVENLIHAFASIPLYDRVAIPVDDLPENTRLEMESTAAMHSKKYLEKRSSKSEQKTKNSQPKKMNKIRGSHPSESLMRSLYGGDFSSNCIKYLMNHSSKPLSVDTLIFNDEDMGEVEEKDGKQWKKDFDEFLTKFEGDNNRTVAIISSEESELSEEFDEGFEETYDMMERFERLGKIINASASSVSKEKKIIPERILNVDFDQLNYDVNKPYPHEFNARNISQNAEDRKARRIERNKIRKEREKRRLQRLSLSKIDQIEPSEELLPHAPIDAPADTKEKKKSKKKSSSSSDDDDLKHLEWKADRKIKTNLSKEKRKRSKQVDKSIKKKGLYFD